jgi:hypothetical protein
MSLTPIYDDLMRELDEIAKEAGLSTPDAEAEPESD